MPFSGATQTGNTNDPYRSNQLLPTYSCESKSLGSLSLEHLALVDAPPSMFLRAVFRLCGGAWFVLSVAPLMVCPLYLSFVQLCKKIGLCTKRRLFKNSVLC